LLPIAIDAILAFWLFMLLKKQISEDEAFRWGMVYALNPVTIFISAIHGQFDTLPTMLTLAALLSIPSSAWKTGVFLGLGILNKSWPVLAWPQIMSNIGSWRKRIIATLFMGMVLLAAILLYTWLFDANLLTGLQKAISYNWGIGIWGYTYFVQMALMRLPGWPGTWGWFIKISRFVTLGILAWIWFARTRFQSSVRGFLGIMLGFFALGHAFSIQYLLWPVAFAVYLQEEKWLARYIISASAYMFLVYYTLILDNVIMRLLPWPQADWYIIMPAGIPVWVVTLFWLRKSLQRPSKAPVNIG
jgi:Gpi18-like mannosyltransferase